MALSEIEKLERRYAENPQGLTFAPLAEVHRKNGEVQRALDLLGPGLALHPDYIPASIVLGRCHLDLGDVHAAEKAFLHVLALDGENVIALKALADISERLLKLEDAERWLRTLLSVDRSNDDAREQLQRVEIARRQAEVASSVQPESTLEPEKPQATAAAAPEVAASGAPPVIAPAFEPPVAEPTAGWVSHASQVQDPVPASDILEPAALRDQFEDPGGVELEEPSRYDEPSQYEEDVEPIEGLVGREVDEPDETADEFRVETSEAIVLRSAGGNEFQVPDASEELVTREPVAERMPFEENAPLPEPVAESPTAPAESVAPPEPAPPEPEFEPLPEFADWRNRAEEPARDAPEPAPEPIALEPDAQPAALEAEPEPVWSGRTEAAPEPVWSEPEPEPEPERSPSEPDPVAVPIDHFPVTAAHTDPPAPPAPEPRRAYAAGDTGGRPVGGLLKDILSARPPAQAAAPAVRPTPASGGGAPTRPAADALSLSSVFGEEESPGTPPAVPASGGGAGVSFDDFFGAPGATPTQRGPRAPDPKKDDLDQFHAWLQNLKR